MHIINNQLKRIRLQEKFFKTLNFCNVFFLSLNFAQIKRRTLTMSPLNLKSSGGYPLVSERLQSNAEWNRQMSVFVVSCRLDLLCNHIFCEKFLQFFKVEIIFFEGGILELSFNELNESFFCVIFFFFFKNWS